MITTKRAHLVLGLCVLALLGGCSTAKKATNEAREKYSVTCLKRGYAVGTAKHDNCVLELYKDAEYREKAMVQAAKPVKPIKPKPKQETKPSSPEPIVHPAYRERANAN